MLTKEDAYLKVLGAQNTEFWRPVLTLCVTIDHTNFNVITRSSGTVLSTKCYHYSVIILSDKCSEEITSISECLQAYEILKNFAISNYEFDNMGRGTSFCRHLSAELANVKFFLVSDIFNLISVSTHSSIPKK